MTTTTEVSIPIDAVRQIMASAERLTGGFYGHDANGLLDACKAIVSDREELLAKIDGLKDELLDEEEAKREAEGEAEGLRDQIDDLETEVTDLESKVSDLEAELEAAKK
jgi:chromosome segregation ATPase